MFINRVSRRLLAAPEMAPLLRELSAGNDATLAVAQSARPLVLAALWAKDPRPCLLVVSGEEVRMLPAQPLTVADRMVELLPGVVEDMKHIFSKDGRKQSSTPIYGEG